VLAAELGRGHGQAAHQCKMRVAQRELRSAKPGHSPTNHREFLARPRLGGVSQECIFDVGHAP
jgi:hypothetical protein